MGKDAKKKPLKGKSPAVKKAARKVAKPEGAKSQGAKSQGAKSLAGKSQLAKAKVVKSLVAKSLVAKRKAALPAPPDLPVAATPGKRVLLAEGRHLAPLEVPATGDVTVLQRLWETVEARRLAGDAAHSHSARLMARGTAKVAQKLGEEAVECVIEATLGNRQPTILESADLLYHLVVLWVDAGIRPEEVWAELVRREGVSGIVEKASRPKAILRAAATTKLP